MNPGKAPMSERRKEKRVDHTPTPWRAITNDSGKTFEEVYEVRNELGEIACFVPFPKKDTAAFIIRAVNDYERLKHIEGKAALAIDALDTLQKRNVTLLKACEKVRDMVSAVCNCDPLTPGLSKAERTCDFCLAGDILKKAIANAEGK